jgi:hypothetical protein
MKITGLLKIITGLFVAIDTSISQNNTRHNYNIMLPANFDMNVILETIPQALRLHMTTVYDTNTNINTLALTTTEAQLIADLIKPYKGLIELDYVYEPTIEDVTNNSIITSVPNCSVPIYGEDVVIMGTKIYPNQPALQKYQTAVIYDHYNNAPACNPHETKVTEVITQVINGGDVMFLNAITADCNARTPLSAFSTAVNAAIEYKQKVSKQRRMTINISSSGPYSEILNFVFTNAVKAGIRVVASAGNTASNAANYSPASLGCTVAETIGSTNGQAPASFTNYGECVDVYLPGCMPLRHPSSGEVFISCGTSYSTPLQTARGLIQRFYNPQDSIANIKTTLQAETITIPVPAGYAFSGTMRVINTALQCPRNTNSVIFKGIVPVNRWFALAPPKLCVQFAASRKNGALIIKFVDNDAATCTVTLANNHSIVCDNKNLTAVQTTKARLPAKPRSFTIAQENNTLLISYKNKKRNQQVLTATGIGTPYAIAFDKQGKTTIKNAMHCNM